MHLLLEILGAASLVLALAGSAYQVLAAARIAAFRSPPLAGSAAESPAVTLLKPLHGAEPGLEAALRSGLDQDYPGEVQMVLGVQDPADPALDAAKALRAAYPARDVVVVADPTPHGANRKIANLINMAPRARHGLIVLSDSDIAVRPDYLRRVVAALSEPGVGVVTCPYYGEGRAGFWSRLAAMGLTYQFLPSVAVGVTLGLATPCMGSTIALSGETLARIGGFEAFADLLADDYAIGAAVRALGLRSVVAPVLVAHGCAEATLGDVVRHELRWALTVRGVDPAGFFGSGVTHAIPLALLGVLFTAAAPAALAVLAIALICRLWTMRQVDEAAGIARGGWLLAPARDILSFAIFAGSFFVRAVEWRGTRFRVDPQGALERI
ncbi:bacteriohopanetetrol glucosamine biosynthesis glycosyltransferase HpnI [Phenylobacterium sp.]|uniref:bacteriohopanetetrol glucosamine biosynthesis glycosyltransferase HpnI n=1 Tax=Phenylobacterium sp. TaxID=1871053 RepID=UPI0012294804|nr:bacteriohopanetetrol glucosamine biosynthesis glycosyltransferase HpnI [Phenylobacterium sp.]THD61322.1 MAG: glycosyltransferase [Phenylobacterium sp.]